MRCFGSLAEAAYLRDDVNALNLASLRPDPFLTFEFFDNFMRCEASFPSTEGMRLWFLAAFDAGRLIGYLALKHATHTVLGMRASKVDFLVTHDADRPQLVARAEHAPAVSEAFHRYLWERRNEWSFVEFRQQDATSPLLPPPATVNLKGCWVSQWPSMDNGTIPVRWDSLSAYFKSFSKKFRSNVSRQMRTLLAAGKVEYLVSSDPGTTPALFELYCSIEPRSWKSRAGSAIGRHPHWTEYFKGLLEAHQPMRISIHVLLLDGVPVAGLITGAFEQGLYALHIVSDNSLMRLAPGSAVLLMGMREAIGGGHTFTFFNLLSGFGYYKARWHAQMTETSNAQIYRIGTPFFWHRRLGDLKRWLFRATEKHAAVLFNPTRREIIENHEESANDALHPPQLPSHEYARIAALINQARQGCGEFLDAGQFAALMPFETQRPTPPPQVSKAGTAAAPIEVKVGVPLN